MNKFPIIAAIAITAIFTLASCEQTQTPEQTKLAKKQAIEKEIQTLENELAKLETQRENDVKLLKDEKTGMMKLPSKEEGEKIKQRGNSFRINKQRLDSLRALQ